MIETRTREHLPLAFNSQGEATTVPFVDFDVGPGASCLSDSESGSESVPFCEEEITLVLEYTLLSDECPFIAEPASEGGNKHAASLPERNPHKRFPELPPEPEPEPEPSEAGLGVYL